MKTNARYFKAVAADMKLEQSIQCSKKGPGGIIGQTKHQAYVTEYELAYHEVLAISKSLLKLSKTCSISINLSRGFVNPNFLCTKKDSYTWFQTAAIV